jgi:type IV pilus assembly protein PilV
MLITLKPTLKLPVAARLAGGFTLVEVLVSIVILTFGLLGAVGLILNSLRASNESGNYVTASNLAREYIDKMRANRQISQNQVGNPYLFDSSSNAPSLSGLDCVNANCIANQLAQWDAAEWWSRVSKGSVVDSTSTSTIGLPSPRVVVCFDATPVNAGGQFQWGCNADLKAPAVVKIGWTSRDNTGKKDKGTGTVFDTDNGPRIVMQALPGPGK